MPRLHSRLAFLLLLFSSVSPAAPAWIQDAARPGPDLPPGGQSRFDDLFRTRGGDYAIPYPFERLIEILEARIDNDGRAAVRQVFVPIGRSLQRDTPAPDYFRYPRRVIAVEGEPVVGDGEAGRVMEYRLFIAHQPRTATLEVISYNDDAARFEFQLVDDYREGGTPRVRAANRVMCLSCHHNAAPIFARNPWSETTFNVAVATHLSRALPDLYPSPVDLISLDAGVIDVLAERANYLAAVQFVWQQACPAPACRAAMLRAALQYRLSGKINFDRGAPAYRRDYFAALERNWQRRWPDGLALPGSRIPDRDPFAGTARDARQDPLMPRPPQASWLNVDEALADGVVFRLGGYFTLADIRRLDRRLLRLAETAAAPADRYRAACRARPAGDGLQRLVCGAASGPGSLQATLELDLGERRVSGLRVISVKLPNDTNLWQPGIVDSSSFAGGLEASFGDRHTGLSQRLANGDRLKSMTLDWHEFPPGDGASLEIEVSREFHLLDTALQRLLGDDRGKRFAERIFSREAVLRPLFAELGSAALDWGPPPAAVRAPQRAVSRLAGGLALLEPYCAHCHAGEDPNPPGFLSAGAERGLLVRCAPRMLARVEAWRPGSTLDRSPMPPPASIAFSGTSAARWPASAHYRSLVSSLEKWLTDEYGAAALERWRRSEYDRLPPCVNGVSE